MSAFIAEKEFFSVVLIPIIGAWPEADGRSEPQKPEGFLNPIFRNSMPLLMEK